MRKFSLRLAKITAPMLDSGATAHCFHDKSAFVPGSLKSCEASNDHAWLNATCVVADHCGAVLIPMENANIRLTNVLFIPSLGFNLVSTGRLSDKGIESHFRRNGIKLILESNGSVIGKGDLDSTCYRSHTCVQIMSLQQPSEILLNIGIDALRPCAVATWPHCTNM